MKKVYYSLGQAKRLIPRLKPFLKRLIECHVKINIQNEVTISYDDPYDDMMQSILESKKWHKTNYEYFMLLDKLVSKGIFVKDPGLGLIDFFSKHEGRDIFLCYRYPESNIRYWHEIEEGFEERQSVSLLEGQRKRV